MSIARTWVAARTAAQRDMIPAASVQPGGRHVQHSHHVAVDGSQVAVVGLQKTRGSKVKVKERVVAVAAHPRPSLQRVDDSAAVVKLNLRRSGVDIGRELVYTLGDV